MPQPRRDDKGVRDRLPEALRLAGAGQWERALALLTGSAELAGCHPRRRREHQALVMLAGALLGAGLHDDAETAVRRAIALRPEDAPTRVLASRILLSAASPDQARAEAEQAVRLAPDSYDAVLQAIVALLAGGRTGPALAAAETFAARSGGGAEGAALLGLTLRRLGRLTEARDSFRRLLDRHPGEVQALLWLAHTLHDLGDDAGAIGLYRQVLGHVPGAEEAHHGLVNALATLGRVAEAAGAYAQACRALPGFSQRWPEFVLPADLLAAPVTPRAVPAAGGLAMVLAFVPFDRPVIPLPPAALKAFVEAHTPHRVTAVDLNARFFQAVRRALAERATPFELADNAAFLAAAELLSTDGPAFYDLARYEPAATTFYEQVMALKTRMIDQGKRTLQLHGPIPWHALAMARALLAARPRVVGLSAMYDTQIFAVHALAWAVKALAPETRVVVGGTAFARPGIEELLGAAHVDYVVLQDGEEVLAGLLDALAAGNPSPRLPGLCHRRADGGFEIDDCTQPVRPERIPPADFDDYDLGAYFTPRPVLPVLTSRGCSWRRCTFCNAYHTYAGRYTVQPVAGVVDEMEAHRRRYGVRHFYLVDKIISAARYRRLGEEILARGLDVTYYGLCKPSADFTPEVAATAFRSGLRYLLWGQESGSDRILAAMDKGNTVAASRQAYAAAAAAGIRNHLFMIVGFPTEGLPELAETVAFLTEAGGVVDQVQCGPFVLEKGTPLHADPDKFGITRIIDRRCTGRMQLLRFETARGFTAEQTAVVDRVIRQTLLRRAASVSWLFGTFWDHALIHYSALPRADQPVPDLPAAAVVMAAVEAALAAPAC